MAGRETVKTPVELAYHMPAEWEPHSATWIAWPHERSDWPGKFAPVPWIYGEVVRHLSRVERVCILVQDEAAREQARRILKRCHADLNAVLFVIAKTNRSWTRDYCPIFVRGSENNMAVLNWQFNGWAKYDNWQDDDAITPYLAQQFGWPVWNPAIAGRRIVLEGGSIDVNGAGTILTTEECLLSPVQARNPELSKREIEEVFQHYLGARHTLWLRNGIAGDDTHGHVDDLARFTDERTVVIVKEDNPRDPNHEPLAENIELLREMHDQDGAPLRIVTLPMPEPVHFAGQRLPASYGNFYIANHLVLVPTFNDPNDRLALNTVAELFPSRKVVGIACTDLVLGLGTLHCMTQQQPA